MPMSHPPSVTGLGQGCNIQQVFPPATLSELWIVIAAEDACEKAIARERIWM